MSAIKRIALIGFTDLEIAGLRFLLDKCWDGLTEAFADAQVFKKFSDRFEAFIITTDIFYSAIDFFMPRRHKTLVIADHLSNDSSFNEEMVDKRSSETSILKAINSLVDLLTQKENDAGDLSGRELEVLRLLASGKINKEIADILCISINTVITHRKNISAKLGIKSAQGLSLYAMMNGII